MKCYWCGKENKNLEIDQDGKVLKHFPCADCNQPERSKREDIFVFKPEKYDGPIAIDLKPSKECDEYHKRAQVQINMKNDAVL